MVDAVLTIKKRLPTSALSIEVRSGSQPDPYITFTQPNWYATHTEWLNEVCEMHKLSYQIVPQDNKLVIVLQRNVY
jgi:hypothetical protein